MKKIVLKGRKIVGGQAEGEALVSSQSISFGGGIDPYTGNVTERGHPLMNENIKGKILVFPMGKGSSWFSPMAHVSRLAGTNPKAIIVREINPQVALATVVMHIPGIAYLDKNPTEVISTGDWVRIDADKGLVEIKSRSVSRLSPRKLH